MNLVSKREMMKFKRLENHVKQLTELECENPTADNEKILNEYVRLVDKYDRIGISTDGYIQYYQL